MKYPKVLPHCALPAALVRLNEEASERLQLMVYEVLSVRLLAGTRLFTTVREIAQGMRLVDGARAMVNDRLAADPTPTPYEVARTSYRGIESTLYLGDVHVEQLGPFEEEPARAVVRLDVHLLVNGRLLREGVVFFWNGSEWVSPWRSPEVAMEAYIAFELSATPNHAERRAAGVTHLVDTLEAIDDGRLHTTLPTWWQNLTQTD